MMVFGLLAGIAPLIAGRRTENQKLGNIGFFLCLTGGLIPGLYLSFPIALIFVVLILTPRKEKNK